LRASGVDALHLVGAGQAFGAGALAVAVIDNDGRAQPVPFREFWLVRPAAGARQLRLYALADSQAVTGAFQIDLVPGATSRAQVRLALFPRAGAGKLLLAPLAGSFVQGEQRPGRALPLQGEVHSVDGLAVNTATGGWIWRPLDNPPDRRADSFPVNTPRGFGLLQRDRDVDSTTRPGRPPIRASPMCGWCRALTGVRVSCACSRARPTARMYEMCWSVSYRTASRNPATHWS